MQKRDDVDLVHALDMPGQVALQILQIARVPDILRLEGGCDPLVDHQRIQLVDTRSRGDHHLPRVFHQTAVT